MMAEIRRRVEEGRWNITGGWWVEPDMNLPSGEAMARQGLYGQLTFQKLTGRRASTGFCSDSFGHAGTVPQILRLQGMDNYVFSRPGHHEKTLPADLFWWESPDGSRVLAYRQFGDVSGDDSADLRRRMMNQYNAAKSLPVPAVIGWYGVGDHGGGPTKAHIRAIEEVKGEKGAPPMFYSSEDRYFEDVRADKNLNLPVVRDDLQHHATGCYTAEWEIKKNNRTSENLLVTAEKITAAGAFIWEADYPKDRFDQAWRKLLLLQFHDSLAGSSLVDHSRDARDGFGHIMDTARDAIYLALQKLEWQIPAENPHCKYMVVFNPHAWEVKRIVEYTLAPPHETFPPFPSRFVDDRENSFPHQWEKGQSQTTNRILTAVIEVTLPPFGYKQIREVVADSAPVFENPAKAEGNRLENEYLRINVSPDGAIGIFDKESGQQVFANGETGCRAVVIDDPHDTWGHDVVAFDKEIGAFGQASVTVVEKGPLRATLRVITTYGQSTLTVDWSLTAGSREVGAKVSLDWHERRKMLKFSFPVDVESPVATYETPYGFIVRETNGNEEPGQRWIDLTGQRDGDTRGLTVINDAKYGYSVSDNDMRLSVTRSTVFALHDPVQLEPDEEYVWMEQGIQTFRLLLVPHRGSWKDALIPRIAEEFMTPPIPVYQGIHQGTKPTSGSFLSVGSPNVIVSAIKQSEEGDDLILRLVETFGEAVTATLRFPSVNRRWQGSFRPCEIKTLRLNTSTGNIKEVNLLEE
jgi:alpha-mannosidase